MCQTDPDKVIKTKSTLTKSSIRVARRYSFAHFARVQYVAGDDLLFVLLLLAATCRRGCGLTLAGRLRGVCVHGGVVGVTVAAWNGINELFSLSIEIFKLSSITIINCLRYIWSKFD